MSMGNDSLHLPQYGHSGQLIQEMKRNHGCCTRALNSEHSVMDYLEQFAHTLLLVERLDSYCITRQFRC
jgi:hypothetical protein